MSCRHKAKSDALLRDQSVDRGDSNEAANQVTGMPVLSPEFRTDPRHRQSRSGCCCNWRGDRCRSSWGRSNLAA